MTIARPVFRDGVLEDPFLSASGDAEWISEWLGRQVMMEAAHEAGVGLGRDQPEPAQAFTEKEMDSHPPHPALPEAAECTAFRERMMLSRYNLRYQSSRSVSDIQ